MGTLTQSAIGVHAGRLLHTHSYIPTIPTDSERFLLFAYDEHRATCCRCHPPSTTSQHCTQSTTPQPPKQCTRDEALSSPAEGRLIATDVVRGPHSRKGAKPRFELADAQLIWKITLALFGKVVIGSKETVP